MSGKAAQRAADMLDTQRRAILSGSYPSEEDLERLGRLLSRIAPEMLPPLSELLKRNLELLAIARDAVRRGQTDRAPLCTYGPDGQSRELRPEERVSIRR